MGQYRTIVADPPWPYPGGWPGWSNVGKRRALPYPSMSVDAIAALPVRSLLANEGYVFLWTTNLYLEDSFRVLRAWDCTPKQTLVWCKEPMGNGPGGMFAVTTEFVVIGQRINPGTHAHGSRTKRDRLPTSWFRWPRGAHSQKPEAFQDLVEQVSSGPYLELFARRHRLGWDVWGNEVESTIALATDDEDVEAERFLGPVLPLCPVLVDTLSTGLAWDEWGQSFSPEQGDEYVRVMRAMLREG